MRMTSKKRGLFHASGTDPPQIPAFNRARDPLARWGTKLLTLSGCCPDHGKESPAIFFYVIEACKGKGKFSQLLKVSN